jgi:hypothetical protein
MPAPAASRNPKPDAARASRNFAREWRATLAREYTRPMFRLRLLRAAMVACLSLLPLAGCPVGQPNAADEGDGAAEDNEDDESADSATRLDELDTAEVNELCSDLNLELEMRFDNRRLATYGCVRLYVTSGDSEICALGVEDCVRQAPLAAPGAARPPEFEVGAMECAALGDCGVSVELFDTCIEERFTELDRLLRLMSCSLANDPEALESALLAIDGPRTPPPSCTTLLAACSSPF